MGTPQKFNDIIHEHLHAHAAWLPITNTYRLGDYGLIADGVFNKIGNIKDDFGVMFEEGAGPNANLDFVSADTDYCQHGRRPEGRRHPGGRCRRQGDL